MFDYLQFWFAKVLVAFGIWMFIAFLVVFACACNALWKSYVYRTKGPVGQNIRKSILAITSNRRISRFNLQVSVLGERVVFNNFHSEKNTRLNNLYHRVIDQLAKEGEIIVEKDSHAAWVIRKEV